MKKETKEFMPTKQALRRIQFRWKKINLVTNFDLGNNSIMTNNSTHMHQIQVFPI